MLYLKNEKEVRLFKIIETEETEVEKVFKTILKEYDNIISQGSYDIENCQTIKHVIRILNEIPVVGKQDY